MGCVGEQCVSDGQLGPEVRRIVPVDPFGRWDVQCFTAAQFRDALCPGETEATGFERMLVAMYAFATSESLLEQEIVREQNIRRDYVQ